MADHTPDSSLVRLVLREDREAGHFVEAYLNPSGGLTVYVSRPLSLTDDKCVWMGDNVLAARAWIKDNHCGN